jgi:hypothetical protein
VGIVETYRVAYGNKPGLIKAQLTAQGVAVADLNNPDPSKLAKALEVCREEYLSCMVLQGSDNTRFYQLKINLANSMTMKKDKFLKTMVEMQHLLNNYKVPPRQLRVRGPDSNGVAFVQDDGQDLQPPTAPLTKDINCWHCGLKGHYKSNCPKLQSRSWIWGCKTSTSTCVMRHTACSQPTRAGEWYKKKAGEIRSARHPLEAPRVHQHVHELFKRTIPRPP